MFYINLIDIETPIEIHYRKKKLHFLISFINLPYDLSQNAYYNPKTSVQSFYPTNGIDYAHFGGKSIPKIDPLIGLLSNCYIFNILKYVQNIVTMYEVSYGLSLTAPYTLYYCSYSLLFSNLLPFGSIKIENGNNLNYKLKLRIVDSKN